MDGIKKATVPRGKIDSTGAKSIGKGAAIGGLGALIVGVLIEVGALPRDLQGPQTVALLTAAASVGVNALRKLLTRYNIDV